MIVLAISLNDAVLLIVLVLDVRRLATVGCNRFAGELIAGVLEGTRIDDSSAGRGVTGDLHQLLTLPGEIEPRRARIVEFPGVLNPPLRIVIHFE